MANYLEHIKNKHPHARRAHAMQLSAAIVIVIFIAWLATLSLRFASTPPQSADSNNVSQLANVASGVDAQSGQATLMVAPTPTQ